MLGSSCPVCGARCQGEDLKRLTKAVRECCRKKGTKTPAKPRITEIPIPPLPLVFRFNRSPLSQNKTTYAHWKVYAKDKSNWQQLMTEILPYDGLHLQTSCWSITRVYTHPAKEFDYANLVGGCKPLIDLLITGGLILDDSPSHFKCTYSQERGDATYTLLTLVSGVASHGSTAS